MVNPSLCNGVHVVCSICFFAQNTLRAHLLWTAFYLSKTQLRVRELNTFTNKHITQSFLDLRNNSSRNSLCCNSGWVSRRTACFARRQLVQFHPNNEQKAAQLWGGVCRWKRAQKKSNTMRHVQIKIMFILPIIDEVKRKRETERLCAWNEPTRI